MKATLLLSRVPRACLLAVLLLWAWFGVPQVGQAQTYTVTVSVTDGGDPAANVRIDVTVRFLTRTEEGVGYTGSGGTMAFSGVPAGASVTLSASQPGYQLSGDQTFTMPFGNTTRNFTRSSTISGAVRRADGTAVSGVTVRRTGSSTNANTSAAGAYTFTGLGRGNYTVTPSKEGLVFRPTNRNVTVGPSQANQNFTVDIPLVLTTLAASNVARGGAVLTATVAGQGTQEARVWFEYGGAGAFTAATPEQVFAASTNQFPVAAALTNLPGGLDYKFRCVAANDSGTNYGAMLGFSMPFPAAGQAVQFNGTGAQVNAGTNATLKMTNRLTLEAWIRPTGPGSHANEGGVIAGREGEYLLARHPSGQLRYALATTTPGFSYTNTGVVVPTNHWTHVALVFDGAATEHRVRVFTNGVRVFTATPVGMIGDAHTAQNDFRIGGRQNTAHHFAGQIDEVRVWRRAREDGEILADFQRRLAGTEPDLVAYFRLDEGTGVAARDSSPSGLVGTLISNATWVASGAGLRDPVVTTLPASPVLATTATLRGTVNPSGANTSYFFEYGHTPSLGQATTPTNLPSSGLAPLPVSTLVTGLDPGTPYYFRLVANNSFGTSAGTNADFTTLVLGYGWPVSSRTTDGQTRSPKHVVDPEGNAYVAGLFTGTASLGANLTPTPAGGTNAFIAKLGRGADWLWGRNIPQSANGSLRINAVALDSARNVHVAGEFTGSATFGANVLTSAGGTDSFVAKLHHTGTNWLWARSAGGTTNDSAQALAVTPSGQVFIAGQFTRTNVFGTTTLVSSNNTADVYVARLDAEGNWLWATAGRSAGANGIARALVVDASTNVYVAGEFATNLVLGGTTLISAGGQDMFVAKLDAGGAWLQARRAGGPSGNDFATGLALDASSRLYVLGKFNGTADFAGTLTNQNAGTTPRLFVARLNNSFSLDYCTVGGEGNADSLAVDGAGQVYVTGDFPFATTFGTNTLATAGNSDVFIAQLGADSGHWHWARRIGSTGNEFRGSVAVDAANGVVVSGTYQNTIQIGHVLLTSANPQEIFVARLDATPVFEHNNYVIGQAIGVPAEALDPSREDGAALGQPAITILDQEHPDSDALNAFVWSLAEKKLYPVRPVTAIIRWPLTTDVTNTTLVAPVVGRMTFPAQPVLHVASVPAELEPDVAGFPLRFLSVAFTTAAGAGVDAATRQFTATGPGWTVLQLLETGGELPNPAAHPSRFEVVRTHPWTNHPNLVENEPAEIGKELTHPAHQDDTGGNGFVFFERACFDGAGTDRAHDRLTRSGPILPVNRDTSAADDDLVVVWYRSNPATGIAWPSLPVRYQARWPTDAEELVLASGEGSGVLPAAEFPDKRVYHQASTNLPGFNPNEEHAALHGDVLYALRNDLNDQVTPRASDPYTLLKYRDPATGRWAMKVYRVVTTSGPHDFSYLGEAGQLLAPPAPLSLLTLCGASNTWVSGPGFQDYLGRLYAGAAGPDGADASIVTRYYYPLQPGFFFDLNRDGVPDLPVGACVPWLDRRPGGTAGVPVNVTYNIVWPETAPTLQIGETLLGAKFGLPNLRNFAHARIIFDEGDPRGTNGVAGLTRMFDPLAPRVVQLRPVGATDFLTGPGYTVFRVADPAALFAGLATANDAGLTVFTDLPFTLRARLRYDALNRNLIFRGLLDERDDYGGPANPLLLLNVLSPNERDRLKQLNGGALNDLMDALYRLTRNPNHLDLDEDGQPDPEFLAGLVRNPGGEVVPETLGAGPKVLTAGQARASGFVTLVENNDPSLGGLPVTLHLIRVEGGPVRGDLKVVQSDNVFDEKLTLRHSADFGGEPQHFEFEWFYRPVEADTDPSAFPTLLPNGAIDDLRGWTQFFNAPHDPNGLNDITLGDGGTSSLLVLADNYFVCRYRGYVINGETNWSDWVGVIGGGKAQLAEGWVKRVRDGLNPFEARTREFHANETVTFASMLQQAGRRYEGDIAFAPGGNVNSVGLIEAYETVLRRTKGLSIEGVPAINYQPANDALLLAAGFIADLYFLLGNEAVADAADPTIGFRTSSAGYGTLAPSIFAFQNQLDSLLEEELCLLRGRDDRSATVRLPPVYNRLFWNFTRDEGEVAYAQAYNITDQNSDGFIDATDARIMYPQAHGDAWGHYLTATKTYYGLLHNPHFDWIPRSEPILLAGVPVMVDYLDERKFARAAAAKAKVGAEVVDLTYRLSYVDDPVGQYQGYKDTDPERAWGLSEWAHRAGSAALFDWVVANAVLPATDPNTNHTGITKIDRTTVPELNEIVAGYEAVQSQVDKADAGLNPLGIAKNSVPFDIDPSLISAGKTHFEQIHDRALEAVNNTVTVFNHANQLSQALRGLQDTVNQFSHNVTQQERDYKNRMIEIFGYPYAGDIGTGRTYPPGYDGPDIYHYMYVNTVELNGQTAPQSEAFTAFFTPRSTFRTNVTHYFEDDLPGLQNPNLTTSNILAITYPQSTADFAFTAPAVWGQRRAPGEIQLALSDLLQSEARMKQALLNYDNLIQQIQDNIQLLEARYNLQTETLAIRDRTSNKVFGWRAYIEAAKATSATLKFAADKVTEVSAIAKESLPKVVGTANDVTSVARGLIKLQSLLGTTGLMLASVGLDATANAAQNRIETLRQKADLEIAAEAFEYEVQQALKGIEQLVRQEAVLRITAFELNEVVQQNVGRYQATLARGVRLMDERTAFRRTAAAETQQSRYQDMTFRIFRHDAIQKYRAQYDLAAQYVYLAAIAYDYETQLLGGRPGSGRSFLTDIVKQRALGEVINGVPVAGRHGLADPLARLSQNFAVLKGQLGFNNPQTETGRFSLRSEMLRLRDTSDAEWRAQLKQSIVRNLWDVPEFRRYCRPFAPESAGPQPGLVIRFPTTVTFGLNYFGWPLGGGDSAYDPTFFATKVRSAGVWFENYHGSGLSQTPRVYLVPVGADVMRSPSGNNLETREWRVVDQKIPVPFPIGFSSLNNAAWIPMNDSLSDTFADIRRFSSFRAYHDSGFFNPLETVTDTRLIGRSVWNTDWMLIIPGGTFLFDPNQGLETFINSVSDIRIFFQTYAYSGN